MNKTTNRKLMLLGVAAAVGIGTVGMTSTASAQRWDGEVYHQERDRYPDRYRDNDRNRYYPGQHWWNQDPHQDRYRGNGWDWSRRYGSDLDRFSGRLDDHLERDMMHYDRNRDGRLDIPEQKDYFRHLAEMGVFGRLSPTEINEVSHVGPQFDQNDDGRLTGRERRGVRLLIRAMRQFDRADRNRDKYLSRREFRLTSNWFPPMYELDTNRDGFVHRHEVRSSVKKAVRANLY